MAHCGLRPQSVHTLGGYNVQRDELELLADAKAAEQAGAFAIVLECIPRDIAKKITDEVAIPTIGIGAGADCDGQVLVLHDLLGITTGYVPRFVKAVRRSENRNHPRRHPIPRRSPRRQVPGERARLRLA